MKTKIFASLIITLFTIFAANAQESKLSLNLNYNYSFPTGNFKSDLVEDASPRGFTGNVMYEISPLVKVGLGVGYQDYYQRYPREVYNYGKSQQLSAVLTNSLQIVPVMARVELYPFAASLSAVRPYIAVAAGANFINYSQYLGQFSSADAITGFRAQGGIGLKIPFSKTGGWGANVGGSYDIAPYKKHGFKDLNTVNIHGGVYFSIE